MHRRLLRSLKANDAGRSVARAQGCEAPAWMAAGESSYVFCAGSIDRENTEADGLGGLASFASFAPGGCGSRRRELRRGFSKRHGRGTRIEQCVEEKLISHFRLRAVLGPETEEYDPAFAHWLFRNHGGAFQKLPSQDPATEQRLIRVKGSDGRRVALNL